VALLGLVLHTWAIHLVMQAHSEHHMVIMPSIIILACGALACRAGVISTATGVLRDECTQDT